MISYKQQKMLLGFVLLLQVGFVSISGVTIVRADGEEPFVGTIEVIDASTITVKITDKELSAWATSDIVTLLITEDTRITKQTENRLKAVSFKTLSGGSLVRVKPNTLPGKAVEADRIDIIRRAEK